MEFLNCLQVVKGLGEYFNVSLGPQLLYSIEKLQYRVRTCKVARMINRDLIKTSRASPLSSEFEDYLEYLQHEDCESAGAVQPADIYGSTHLLRLMVKVNLSDWKKTYVELKVPFFCIYFPNRSNLVDIYASTGQFFHFGVITPNGNTLKTLTWCHQFLTMCLFLRLETICPAATSKKPQQR